MKCEKKKSRKIHQPNEPFMHERAKNEKQNYGDDALFFRNFFVPPLAIR